jgi:hypothetical protein
MDLAAYLSDFNMRGQHTADRAMTRYKYDVAKMTELNEIATSPGRYALGVPNAYGNAAYVANPTIRMQKWGASHDMSSTKTDVESDLRNLARPVTRTVCGQYQPEEGMARAARLTPMPEADFPRTYERLVDPACNVKGVGVNRWQWLCQDPQENVLLPFEHGINTQLASRDGYLSKLTLPLEASRTAADHRAFCGGPTYIPPTVPTPTAGGATKEFTNAISGGSNGPIDTPPPARVHSVYGGPEQPAPGSCPDVPPRGSGVSTLERLQKSQGILVAPPPFTTQIQYQ